MSRIGKKPISIPAGVVVTKTDSSVLVKGPIGEKSIEFSSDVSVNVNESNIDVALESNKKEKWGLYRTLISNAVEGVSSGFKKVLLVNGVGYKAVIKDNFLTLTLGLSHEVKIEIPEYITLKAPKPTQLEITSYDKEKLGQFASVIRDLRLPEPYKGKGIKYEGEFIFRKEGKK